MIPEGILPESIGTRWCVAGGWAACPAQAADQDIWVFADMENDEDPVEMRERLLAHLRGFFGEDFDDRVTVLEDSRTTEGGDNYESLPVLTLKVAKFYLRGIERHLLVTTATCAYELVEAFDVSTHAVAIEHDGNVVKASTWTQITLPPTMVRDTPTTRERMIKIAKRYGLYAPLAEHKENFTDDDIPF